LDEKNRGLGLENREYDRTVSAAMSTRHTLSSNLALTSPTGGGRSVGIVRSQPQAIKFCFILKNEVGHVPVFTYMRSNSLTHDRLAWNLIELRYWRPPKRVPLQLPAIGFSVNQSDVSDVPICQMQRV
jgi:hypothetical protein